jgi:hypothetical protein
VHPQVGHCILLFAALLVALDRGGDGIQKILIAKRLAQEIDEPSSRAPSSEYRHVR